MCVSGMVICLGYSIQLTLNNTTFIQNRRTKALGIHKSKASEKKEHLLIIKKSVGKNLLKNSSESNFKIYG